MSSIPHTHAAVLAWHFRAGPASLGVSAIDAVPGSAPPCAAEAAVVLDLAGELLDALAAAGLTPADPWHWVAQPAGPAPGAQASWRGAQAEAQLWLPWGVLRALAEAPDVPGLQWHATPAECVLAHWQLAADELAALEPGGLLLLEQPVGDALRARGEATPGDRGQQLVARWEQPLPADVVLGWTGMRPALPVACQLIDAARPDAVLARGRLLPWGSGHALRIDSL